MCLLLSCNFLLAQGIGLSSGMNEVLGDMKGFATGAVIIGFLITCVVAIRDYSEHRDVAKALWILVIGIAITLAVVGGYAFVKSRVKFA
ncbi:hypothetical protein KRE40_18575 [Elizabethkingia meningoseptica]|uniref:hypothetical protein n=1 Tax=Elizabethkingia TaxID=308865 RepID=UPI000F7715E9|nr:MULTISPECIES: hypothetical protein [Elizabethkingia]MDE5510647.1 hypothetical protein [Elizabethkingia meningoseptica]